MGGFWNYAEEDPNYLAIVDPDGTEYSSGEVLARANQVVHALRSLGMEKGDTVAAVLPNGAHPFHIYLAALQAGFYYVPINYRLSPVEVAYILQDSDAKVFVSHERHADLASAAAEEAGIAAEHRLSHGSVPGFRSFAELLDAQPTTKPEDRATGAAMHYTSGTTGKPKGVKRALAQIDPDTSAELFTFLLSLFGIGANNDNVHLCTSPNYHTAVTTFAGNALHAKHTVVFMDRWNPEEALRLIERYKCTHTHMVPTQFIRMLQLPDDVKAKYDVSSMKWAIHAAAPCPVDTKRKMLEWWGPVIWEYYAATEGGGTLAPPDEWIKYPGTVGRAWPTSTLKITDDDGNNVLPTGEPGTVWMRMGEGRTFEYKGDTEKTNKSHDSEGYFTVGDVGYFNEDGYLFLCDRKSDMIIAGGVNIYPAEIESVIHEHPQVADVAVFGVPDDDMGEQIKAVVEPLDGVVADDALRASIMEHIQGKLGKYKWPRTIDFLDELPREPTGKLLKRKLRDPYWEGRERANLKIRVSYQETKAKPTGGEAQPESTNEGRMGVTETITVHHELEYPGGYTRSTGPVVGRFLTGLRDGELLGVRLSDGRVLVPPTEYDPATSAEVAPDGDHWVTLGPAGRVQSWTWVAEPRAGKHALTKPFAFALIRPDGADTALLHMVDCGSPDAITVGLRVAPRWRAERTGHITDIEAWEPLGDGEEPHPAPLRMPEEDEQPVTGIVSAFTLEYELNAGQAVSQYLVGLAEGRIIGGRAPNGTDVYAASRVTDPKTGEPTTIEVDVQDSGVVTTFCIVNIPGLSELAPEIPFASAQILLDGADNTFFGLIRGVPVDDVRMGMRVKAKWADELKPDHTSILWWEPTGEPDADYDSYKDYL